VGQFFQGFPEEDAIIRIVIGKDQIEERRIHEVNVPIKIVHGIPMKLYNLLTFNFKR
jgi:hypothetical protein